MGAASCKARGRSGDDGIKHDDRLGEQLVSRIGPHRYGMWFQHARLGISGDTLRVATPSAFVAKWIDSHYGGELRSVANDAIGGRAQVDIHVDPELSRRRGRTEEDEADLDDDAAPAEAPVERTPPRRRPPARDAAESRTAAGSSRAKKPAGAMPLRRLEDFVRGSSSQLALSASERICDPAAGTTVSPLFIYAECGLGKTHLLQGICRRVQEKYGNAQSVRYVTGEQFTNEYVNAVRTREIEPFRDRYRSLDLLLVDDVHFLANKVRTQSEFLHTLDAITLSGARVVLAAGEHPRQIKQFSRALISRFISGMVVQIESPDRETRFNLVRQIAKQRGVSLNEAAVEVVASNCLGSVREIEGAVTKLKAVQMLTSAQGNATGNEKKNTQIGAVAVRQVFDNYQQRPSAPIKVSSIIDLTCERMSVSKADLLGPGRHRRVVIARALVAYLGRELTTQSYPEIAQELGRRYHSTVHTAAQRFGRQLAEDLTVELGSGQGEVRLKELADQVRHSLLNQAGRR